MRAPHTRSAVAENCEAVEVELFFLLSEQARGADLAPPGGPRARWAIESMNPTELRLVLRSFGILALATLAERSMVR